MPMRPQLRRRGALLAASLICTALCAGCGELHAQTKNGPPRPLTVAIAAQPSALYAPLYTGLADGEFALGALTLTIVHPANALGALESGAANVAVVSEPALLAARDGGASLVAIGALEQQPLDGIVSLASQPVTSAAALAGRTIAISPTPLAAAELASALASANVAPSKVHEITLAGSLQAVLHAKRASATLGELWPIEQAALALAHQPAKVLALQQAGVPPYSQLVLVVSVSEAHYHGPLLRAFLQALTRAQRAVAADPAAAAATLAKLNPSFSAAFERALLGELLPLVSPSSQSEPFGYQSPVAWQAFGVWMHEHGLLSKAQNPALAITDEFLPGQGEQVVTSS